MSTLHYVTACVWIYLSYMKHTDEYFFAAIHEGIIRVLFLVLCTWKDVSRPTLVVTSDCSTECCVSTVSYRPFHSEPWHQQHLAGPLPHCYFPPLLGTVLCEPLGWLCLSMSWSIISRVKWIPWTGEEKKRSVPGPEAKMENPTQCTMIQLGCRSLLLFFIFYLWNNKSRTRRGAQGFPPSSCGRTTSALALQQSGDTHFINRHTWKKKKNTPYQMGTRHFLHCVGESLFLQLAKPKSIWVNDLKDYLHLGSPPYCFTRKQNKTKKTFKLQRLIT